MSTLKWTGTLDILKVFIFKNTLRILIFLNSFLLTFHDLSIFFRISNLSDRQTILDILKKILKSSNVSNKLFKKIRT
jgi:hypothetical protein